MKNILYRAAVCFADYFTELGMPTALFGSLARVGEGRDIDLIVISSFNRAEFGISKLGKAEIVLTRLSSGYLAAHPFA